MNANFENLILVIVAVATGTIMVHGLLVHSSITVSNVWSWIGRTLYGALLALILGYVGMKLGIAMGISILTWVGAVFGGIVGFTMIINRFFVWVWKLFWGIKTWWIKMIIGAIVVLAIVAIIM